jgi:hypothetical protein
VRPAMLFPKAILEAEWAADAPFREAMAIKRERLRARRSGQPSSGLASEERVRDQAGAISGAVGAEHCPSFFSGWSCCSCAGRWTGLS